MTYLRLLLSSIFSTVGVATLLIHLGLSFLPSYLLGIVIGLLLNKDIFNKGFLKNEN